MIPDHILHSVFAHRGVHDNKTVRENSLRSLDLAVEAGFGAEVDVLCLDSGELALRHGPASRQKARVAMQSEQIGSYDVLEEALALIGGRVPLIVELKHPCEARPEVLAKALRSVRTYPGPILVSSFDTRILDAREQLDKVPIGLVSIGLQSPPLLPFDFALVYRHAPSLSKWLARGVPIGLWTYRSLASAQRAVTARSVFAIADIPPGEVQKALF